MVLLTDLIIDISVVEAVRAYDRIRAREVEYDYEVCDDNLLPLRRMEAMMTDCVCQRPPIDIYRCGRLYKISNGRHRVARALIMGEISIATGHADFVRDGGESNPGPPRVDRQRNGEAPRRGANPVRVAGDRDEELEAIRRGINEGRRLARRRRVLAAAEVGLDEWQTDAAYVRLFEAGFRTPAQLDTFNNWVRANMARLSERTLQVCHQCDRVSHELCEHFLPQQPERPANRLAPVDLTPTLNPVRTSPRLWGWANWLIPRGTLDVRTLNQGRYAAFQTIDTRELVIPELYRHLMLKKSVKYENSTQATIHLKQLAVSWMTEKINPTDESVSLMLSTIQKVRDEMDSEQLLKYRQPNRAFWMGCLMRLISCFAIIVVFFLFASWFYQLQNRGSAEEAMNTMTHRTLSAIIGFAVLVLGSCLLWRAGNFPALA